MQDRENGVEGAFRRNVKTVYRLCYSYLGNAAEAEDATQSVFMKLVDAPRSFNDHEHEKAWLLRVAANHCKDVLKSAARTRTTSLWDSNSSGREAASPDAPAGPAAAANAASGIADPNAQMEQSEVLQAVLSLPSVYKDCVYLHYYEGYKTDEIAQMTDSNPSTVRNRLADARKMLKKALEA